MQRVTLKSIGQDLGVSHITVSRALSGHPSVSAKTREAVLAHAKKLGYVKSAAANVLRGNGAGIVGLLLPNVVNEFYARFANTLGQACAEQALQLIIHLTNDKAENEHRAIQRLREVDAQDLILVPTANEDTRSLELLRGINVVQLVRTRTLSTPSASVRVDDTNAIIEAVQHLAAQGHTRIGYIGADHKLSSGSSRLSAFNRGLSAVQLAPQPGLILTGPPSFSLGYEGVTTLLAGQQCTALVCGGVEISSGASTACLRQGVRLGRDLAFVGYGDPAYYEWIDGGLTTIQIDADLLAERTFTLVSQVSKAQSPAGQQCSVDARLVIRASTVGRESL